MAFIGTVPSSIVDISKGGMAVHYTLFETGPAKNLYLDLFQSSENFYLQHLPAEIVDDVQRTDGVPGGFIQVKRLSLRFGELTNNQRTQLNYFILHSKLSEV